MKAIVVNEFGGPEVMKLEDVPVPEPSEAQVLVQIAASGVNPVDTYIRSGIHAVRPKLPYTPGKDGAGVVEAVGDGVSKFKPGDRVYVADSLTGTYAEFALCRVEQVGVLPEGVSFEGGAGVFTPYATAYRALRQKAGAMAGETVLIHGASGGVGLAAIQWAKHAELTVIGTASSEEGKRLALEVGATQVFDHSDPEHFKHILDATAGEGVDIIIEMLANVNLEKDFEVLKKFGRVVVVGSRGSLEFTPRLAMTKDATIYGMSLFNAPTAALNEIHGKIHDGLSAGYLRPRIHKSFPLADAAAAHREVIEGKAQGKIILTS